MKEIIELRKEKEKHFLCEDGTMKAYKYRDIIHFNKDGKYEEINNTIIKAKEYYTNKANDFKISFSNDIEDSLIYKIEKGETYLNVRLRDKKEKSCQIKTEKNTIIYNNIQENIDFIYKLISKKIKETIVIKNKKSIDVGFVIDTNLKLKYNQDTIEAFQDDKVIYKFEPLFMYDSNNNKSTQLKYILKEKDNTYNLKLELDKEWIENAAFPIFIDPTINGDASGPADTFIYPNDTNISRGTLNYLKIGVDENNVAHRSLLKFDLPEINTSCQIIKAEVLMVSHTYDYTFVDENYKVKMATVHMINSAWDETTANWQNLNDKYDSKIEYATNLVRTLMVLEDGAYTEHPMVNRLDITNAVKKWYTDTPNNGIMIKMLDETYDSKCKPYIMYSKDSDVADISGNKAIPQLIIHYKKQSGLLDYMQYNTINHKNGSTHINLYNGSLTHIFNITSTLGGKFPVGLNLVNTSTEIIYSNIHAVGWKLSLEETLTIETIDNKEYLIYEDSTSSQSYFYKQEETSDTGTSTITYKSEDGQNISIIPIDTGFEMTDKNGNKKIFTLLDGIYLLTKIINTEKNEINIEYENREITVIKDGNNQEIKVFENTLTNSIIGSDFKTTQITKLANKIYKISAKNTKYTPNDTSSKWNTIEFDSTTFTYDNVTGNISKIIEDDGSGLELQYYDVKPYRIKKVTELGVDGVKGKSLTYTYGFNITTITDDKNHKYTYTFNNQGNQLGTTIMDESGSLRNSYGFNSRYIEASGTNRNNKLSSSTAPLKYAENTIDRYDFDTMSSMTLYFSGGEPTTEVRRASSKSYKGSGKEGYGVILEFEYPIDEDKKFTVSGYIKNSNKVLIDVTFENSGMRVFAVDTIEIPASDEFTRFSYTYNAPGYGNHVYARFKSAEDYYITDCQVDAGDVPEPYNMISNSNFKEPLIGWNYSSTDSEGNNIVNPPEIVTLPNGENALKIKGIPDSTFGANYNFDISGKKGDVYNLSFWYKNEGIHDTELEFVGNKVNMQFVNIDQTMGFGTHNAKLNYHDTEWQFFTETFVAESDYSKFAINILSLNEANNLYITNMMLVKELGQYNFVYDEEGNLISTFDLASNKSEFNYDSDNQLIAAFTPKGNHFNYEYDNIVHTRILKGVSPSGISNEIVYDTNGNPIKTIINNTNPDGELIDNIPYYIRLKGTKKYIDYNFETQKLTLKECNCNHKIFKVHKVDIPNDGTYYRIEFLNKYLGFDGEKITLIEPVTEHSLFTITKKNNGSYNLTPKYRISSQTMNLGINDGNLIVIEAADDDYNQQFYFEDVFTNKFIETSSTYTENGRFITSVTDSLGLKTTYDIDSQTGLINSMTDAKGIETSYQYNDKLQVKSVTNNNKTISYDYNTSDNLSKISSGNKNYTFEYDSFQNPKKVKINDTILLTNEYEPNNNNLLSSTYGNGNEVSYTYDEFDRVKTITTEENTYDYVYNGQGNLGIVKSNLDTHIYHYDFANRLSEYIMAKTFNKFKVHYEYDAAGKIINNTFTSIEDAGLGKGEVKTSDTIEFEYNKDDCITKIFFDDKEINLNYDYLGRLINKNISNNLNVEYQYFSRGDKTSLIVKSMKIENDLYEYKYDNLYNITDIYLNGELTNHYIYDSLNELIEDDNYVTNIKYKYSYDTEGNILKKEEYALETNILTKQDTFEYSNANWEDQLTKFNNETITYDNIGNPLTIGSKNLSWTNGRQLKSYTNTSKALEITYEYNKDGIRLSKTVNGNKTSYYTIGTSIILEKSANSVLYFIRDSVGSLVGFKHNETLYYYIKKLQDDIIGIKDENFNTIATYTYDAWGKLLSIKDNTGADITDTTHIAHINPFRYRSYYYDSESELYYLNSRYYNPNWGRFMNVDGKLLGNGDIISINLYVYTSNRPINMIDSNGQSFSTFLKDLGSATVNAVKTIGEIIVDCGKEAVYTVGNSITRTAVAIVGAAVSMVLPATGSMLMESALDRGGMSLRTREAAINAAKNYKPLRTEIQSHVDMCASDSFVYSKTLNTNGMSDIGLSFGRFSYEVNGNKIDNKWLISVHITDLYDFKYEGKDSDLNVLAKIANNAAFGLQEIGYISTYNWDITYSYIIE